MCILLVGLVFVCVSIDANVCWQMFVYICVCLRVCVSRSLCVNVCVCGAEC